MIASSKGRHLPRLHLVTDAGVLQSADFDHWLEPLLRDGSDRLALHLRAPGLGGRAIWERADRAAEIARSTGTTLIVNDRLDVALAVGAAGAQLGGNSFPLDAARRLLGPDRLLGVSIHSPEEGRAAHEDGADFVLAGTLYRSESHPEREGSGVAWLSELDALGIPIIGIGGITPARVREVRAAGGYGVAVIRGIWHAIDPLVALHEYLAELE